MLPFEEFINWHRYVVWVEHAEVDRIGEIVCDFHSSLSPGDFEELQYECRKIWMQRLSVKGYYTHFRQYLSITKGIDKDANYESITENVA